MEGLTKLFSRSVYFLAHKNLESEPDRAFFDFFFNVSKNNKKELMKHEISQLTG